MHEARIQVAVGDKKRPWCGLSRWEPVSVGRAASSGIHLPNKWVPRGLCRFTATDLGWLVQVGPRARMRVRDPWVGDHVFERRALVALQEGHAVLDFPELDDWCQLAVVVGTDAAADLPEVTDQHDLDDPEQGTAYAVGRYTLSASQRRVLAVTFRHLLTGDPPPSNLVKAAGERMGRSSQGLTNQLHEIRRDINVERWGPKLEDAHQLGDYLVKLTRTIGWNDLPDEHH
ncbi:hypothetical protein [Nocardioides sp. CFH 31398]|uniref:hypothetical protein n=1 Tax=Nocardioides sp. CFH 31398 TaxID=2919579 RepID=UPI001F06C179|nr:hypothetical protein [Nocardioides sp. CFH 31398]MCH1867426.1 hypothetical protein [Nocardioides sp. CFH 31398]